MKVMEFLKSKQGMIVIAIVVILLVILGLYYGGILKF
jgi:hypothetical protein